MFAQIQQKKNHFSFWKYAFIYEDARQNKYCFLCKEVWSTVDADVCNSLCVDIKATPCLLRQLRPRLGKFLQIHDSDWLHSPFDALSF